MKKNYNIALSAFRFLNLTADQEGTSFSALIAEGVLAATEDDLRDRVPKGKRVSRGKGRTQGRKQIGLLLPNKVIKKLDSLASSLDVWPGDIIDACIAIRCQGRDAALKNDSLLLELIASDVIPIKDLPEEATKVSVEGAVTRLSLTSTDIVCIDSTLLFLALTKCNKGYYQTQISPGAAQLLSLVFSGKLRGVTTTLDLLELAAMLENAEILPEWLTARAGRLTKNEVIHEQITRRIHLLSASSIQILDVGISSLIEGVSSSVPTELSLRAKVSTYGAELPSPITVVGCNRGYSNFSPTTVRFMQLGAFDIKSDHTSIGVIVGNRIRPFSEPPEIPKKKPSRYSSKRTLDAHREMLRSAGEELESIRRKISLIAKSDNPDLLAEAERLRKRFDEILENEMTILHMLRSDADQMVKYLPKKF